MQPFMNFHSKYNKSYFLLLPEDSYVKFFDDDLSVEGESPLIVLVPSVLQLSSSITPTRKRLLNCGNSIICVYK